MLRRLPWYVLFLVAACGGAGNSAGSTTLTTVFDSTADTLFALVNGDVAAEAVRHLVTEMEIAPGIDDTTLFTRVWEFDVDRSGRFWVFDVGSRSLFLFGPDGALIRRIGRRGGGPGEFQWNSGMVVMPEDGLALWDSQNARIAFFDREGNSIRQWPLPGGFSSSDGLMADADGQLYLKRPLTKPREGEILGRIGLVRVLDGGVFSDSLLPPDLPVAREVYVASREGNTSSRGSSFGPGYHWALTPRGEFVAVNGGNYELIVERKGAKPLVIRRQLAPVQVSAAEREQEERMITASMRNTDPDWRFNGPAIPSTKAPVRSLAVTRDGRIWVRVATPSEQIPEAEVEQPSDTTQPPNRFRASTEYEVFEPDGRFVGRVTFPRQATLIQADGNQVWGLDEDENGLPAVTRWRVEPGL